VLVLTRKMDESITIGNDITVSVLEIKGNKVKLGINAPKQTLIHRTEIYTAIIEENIKAAGAPQDLTMILDGKLC